MILPVQVISYFVSTVVQVSSCLPDLSSRVVAWLAVFSSVGVLGLTETHPCVRRSQAPSSLFNGLDLTYTWPGFVTLSCVFFSASFFLSPSLSEAWFRFSSLSFPLLCAKVVFTRSCASL